MITKKNKRIFNGPLINLNIDWENNFACYETTTYVWKLFVLPFIDKKNFLSDFDNQFKTNGVYLLVKYGTKLEIYVGQTKNGLKSRIDHHFKTKFSSWLPDKIYLFASEKLFNSLDCLYCYEGAFINFFAENQKLYLINKQKENDWLHYVDQTVFQQMKNLLTFLESKTVKKILPIKPDIDPSIKSKNNFFYFKGEVKKGGNFWAKAKFLPEKKEFWIFKNSYSDIKNFEYDPVYGSENYQKFQTMIKKLLQEKKIIIKNNNYYLIDDCSFSSPSAAAEFIRGGRSTNGWRVWKDQKTNKSLNDFYQRTKNKKK